MITWSNSIWLLILVAELCATSLLAMLILWGCHCCACRKKKKESEKRNSDLVNELQNIQNSRCLLKQTNDTPTPIETKAKGNSPDETKDSEATEGEEPPKEPPKTEEK